MAETSSLGRGAVCLDGSWIEIDFPELANPHLDENQQASAAKSWMESLKADTGNQAVAGIRRRRDGRDVLMWFISDNTHITPPSRMAYARDGFKMFSRWFVGFVVSSLICVWCAFGAFNHLEGAVSWAYFLGFIIFVIAACITGTIMLLGLTLTLVPMLSPVRKLADQAEQDALKAHDFREIAANSQPTGVDDGRPEPVRSDGDTEQDDSEAPPLRLLHGRVNNIKITDAPLGGSYVVPVGDTFVNANNRVNYQFFQFDIDGLQCLLMASRDYGGGDLFLAEGDEVMIVLSQDMDGAGGDSQLPLFVWGLRNLTDGSVYVCHRAMMGQAKRIRKPLIGKPRIIAMTHNYWRFCRLMGLIVYLLVIAVIVGISFGLNDVLPLEVGVIAPLSVFVVFFELPRSIWLQKWRIGFPGHSQKLTQRVYSLLHLGQAWDRRTQVIDI